MSEPEKKTLVVIRPKEKDSDQKSAKATDKTACSPEKEEAKPVDHARMERSKITRYTINDFLKLKIMAQKEDAEMKREEIEDEKYRCCCGILDKRDNFCIQIIKIIVSMILFPFVLFCKLGELFLDHCLDPCCIYSDKFTQYLGIKFDSCLTCCCVPMKNFFNKLGKCLQKGCACFSNICGRTCDCMCISIEKVVYGFFRGVSSCMTSCYKNIQPCLNAIMECLQVIGRCFNSVFKTIANRLKRVCDAVWSVVDAIFTKVSRFLKKVYEKALKPIVNLVKKISGIVYLYVLKPIYRFIKDIIYGKMIKPIGVSIKRTYRAMTKAAGTTRLQPKKKKANPEVKYSQV